MALLLQALINLFLRSAYNPNHLQCVPANTPAAGGFPPAVSECVASPVVIYPVTENWPVCMIVYVERSPTRSLILPNYEANKEAQIKRQE